jgi:hypothetical protein
LIEAEAAIKTIAALAAPVTLGNSNQWPWFYRLGSEWLPSFWNGNLSAIF